MSTGVTGGGAAGRGRPAVSLIEVVVAIAVLGVLAALALPAIGRARAAAGRAQCLNNLRQGVLAVLAYEAVNSKLPPAAVSGPFEHVPDGAGHGVWPFVLNFLGEDSVAAAYRWQVGWDDPGNQPTAAAPVRVLRCPADPNPTVGLIGGGPHRAGVTEFGPIEVNPFLADLGQIDGAASFDGALLVNDHARLGQITDGTAQTLLVIESAGGNPWASPSTLVSVRGAFPADGRHGRGFNAGFADGSGRFLRSSIDVRVAARLVTRAGGEEVSEADY